MTIKIKSVQTICEIGPLCWLYADFLYCLRILSSLASAAGAVVGAGAVLYQNHIRFPLGMRNNTLYKNDGLFYCFKLFKTTNLDKYANPQKSNSLILYSLIIDKKCYLNWFQAGSWVVNRGCNWLRWVCPGPPKEMRCDEM